MKLRKRQIFAGSVLFVLAAIIAVIAWLGNTQAGLHLTVNLVQKYVPSVKIEEAEGQLFHQFSLKNVRYHSEPVNLQLQTVSLDWQWSALLHEEFLARSLTLRHGKLTLHATEDVPQPKDESSMTIEDILATLKLPIKIQLKLLDLKDFTVLQEDKEIVAIEHFRLVSFHWDDAISVKKLTLDSSLINADGSVQVRQSIPYELSGDVNVEYFPPAQPVVNGHIVVGGTTRDAKVDVNISAPYNTKLTAKLSRPLFESPKMEWVLAWEQLNLSAIQSTLPAIILQGKLKGEGNLRKLSYSLENELTSVADENGSTPFYDDSILDMKGQFANDVLAIERAEILLNDNGHLDLHGKVHLAKPHTPFQFKGAWKGIKQTVEIERSREALLQAKTSIHQLNALEEFTIESGGSFELSGDLQKVVLAANSHLNAGEQQGNITLEGKANNLDDLEALNWQASLQWQELLIPWRERVLLPHGSIKGHGQGKEYQFSSDAKVEIAEDFSALLTLSGSGDAQRLTVPTIKIESTAGQLEGNTLVEFSPATTVRAKLVGTHINPEFLDSEWRGDLSLDLDAEAMLADNQSVFSVNQLAVNGKLRERKFSLDSQVDWENAVLTLHRFNLSSGESIAQVKGVLPQHAGNTDGNLTWEIDVKNMQDILPDLKGKVASQGSVKGSIDEPDIQVTANVQNLQSNVVAIASAEADASFKLIRDGQSFISSPIKVGVNVEGLSNGAINIDALNFNMGGALDSHSLGLTLQSDDLDFTLAADGALANSTNQYRWNFSLEESDIHYLDYPAWVLTQAASGNVAADASGMDRACWKSEVSEFCLIAQYNPKEKSQFRLDLEQLPANMLSAFYPETLEIDTQINGSASVELERGALKRIAVDLITSEGKLIWQNIASESTSQQAKSPETLASNPQATDNESEDEIVLGEGHYNLRFEDVLTANVSLPLQNEKGILVNLTTSGAGQPVTEQSLQGRVTIGFDNIGFLTEFIPVLTDIHGTLKGDVEVGGTLAEPVLAGNVNLVDGGLTSEEYGVDWTNIKADLKNHSGSGIAYEISVDSGEGKLKVKGQTVFEMKNFSTELAISGDRFLLVDNEELRLIVSPEVGLTLSNNELRVNGDVIVNKGRFSPKELPKGAVTVSEDQIIVSQNTVVGQQNNLQQYISLNIRIEESVKVTAFGFKGGINGGLKVHGEPGRATTATGQLQVVDGEYRAYGQGLVVDYGKIIFAGGPVDRPGIDIKAHRNPAENITVGVFVQGYLGNTEFKLFSEPAGMSETEQLSWLILGRALEENNTEDNDMLAEAALSLSISRADSVLKKLSGEVGVDSIGISTGTGEAGAASDSNNAELVLGKYLSPELFVSYGIGLFNQINTLRIEYIFNKNWRFATETSTEKVGGGDLIYSREKM
ncbi:Translocation and assembly module TamB [Thalassocella blandensis]|nr:Translocation and assembly module TamB [Thalassocella blandensis]